ncbi:MULTISPECIES: hypothetical protein [unclassified Photobacterium]|uniref:hypothetical protein n=1 Tax=unclassified Photobacterium TaxID=2628852 RepID=UPI001EE0170C|nr:MULTISPECIES: hypothetical protein [unclassified Photobacterium]MCG3863509.1 hypothetical protein [Photobacterium sp. Ph6]MCG3875038.1 hypothetical protein [Photobacterium sp. Ph5]
MLTCGIINLTGTSLLQFNATLIFLGIGWYQLNLVIILFIFVISAVLFMFKPKLIGSFKPQ